MDSFELRDGESDASAPPRRGGKVQRGTVCGIFFFFMNQGSIPVDELDSVSSCDSLVIDDPTELHNIPSMFDIYMNTHVGLSLKKVLADFLDEGRIDIKQCQAITSKFNRIYADAYAQTSNRLKLTVSGKLSDFNSTPSGSVFHIEECIITGPSSSVRLPRGTATFSNANDIFHSDT